MIMVLPLGVLIIILGCIGVFLFSYIVYRILKLAIPAFFKFIFIMVVSIIVLYFLFFTTFGNSIRELVGGMFGDVIGTPTDTENSIKACADTNIFKSLDKWIDDCLKNPLITLPTIAAFLIIYGLLDNVRIFRNGMINVFLAITITLLSVISKFYIIIMIRLFRAMGYWSAGIFTAMFFIGTWYLLVIKKNRWGTQAEIQRTQKGQAEMIDAKIGEVNEAISRAIDRMGSASLEEQEAIKKQIEQLTYLKNQYEATKRNIQRSVT